MSCGERVSYEILAVQLGTARSLIRAIAHAAEYDGHLCPDPDECPGCLAQKYLEDHPE